MFSEVRVCYLEFYPMSMFRTTCSFLDTPGGSCNDQIILSAVCYLMVQRLDYHLVDVRCVGLAPFQLIRYYNIIIFHG